MVFPVFHDLLGDGSKSMMESLHEFPQAAGRGQQPRRHDVP